jgi:hypothetical protein
MNDPFTPPSSRKPRRPSSNPDLPPVGESAQDLTWENDLVLMLSGLETLRARMADAYAANDSARAVEAMVDMVSQVADFAGRRLDTRTHGETLARLRALADGFLTRAREVAGRCDLSLLNSLRRFLAGRKAKPGLRESFRLVRRDLVDLLEQYFAFFTACFHSPTGAHNWAETHEVFLAEVKALVG